MPTKKRTFQDESELNKNSKKTYHLALKSIFIISILFNLAG